MKATKQHTSLDTGKLLKDCGIETSTYYYDNKIVKGNIPYTRIYDDKDLYHISPAFTWGEILWEYPEIFFGEIESVKMAEIICQIVFYLQDNNPENADEYFREVCILIKK